MNQSTGRYFKYALGEIFLVVIGILIALSINNWNEKRKDAKYEITLLTEVQNALLNDSLVTARFYLPRLETKEAGIKKLLAYSGSKSKIQDTTFIRILGDANTDFLYVQDFGPYEAIKQNGLEKISNDALRTTLITSYEQRFPAFESFLREDGPGTELGIIENADKLFRSEVIQHSDGAWRMSQILVVNDVLQHPAFLKILSLEIWKAENQRNRLSALIRMKAELLDEIRLEIKRLN